MLRKIIVILAVTLALTPGSAQAAPTPSVEAPATSAGVDWHPDHEVECEVYPGRVYDIYIQGRKIRTNGTGECKPTKPDYDRSILYIEKHEGLSWSIYASTTLVNPDAKWFQTTTANKCTPDIYRSRMKFYGTEDGDGIVFEHTTAGVYIDCQ
jgi:hypothetical protein